MRLRPTLKPLSKHYRPSRQSLIKSAEWAMDYLTTPHADLKVAKDIAKYLRRVQKQRIKNIRKRYKNLYVPSLYDPINKIDKENRIMNKRLNLRTYNDIMHELKMQKQFFEQKTSSVWGVTQWIKNVKKVTGIKESFRGGEIQDKLREFWLNFNKIKETPAYRVQSKQVYPYLLGNIRRIYEGAPTEEDFFTKAQNYLESEYLKSMETNVVKLPKTKRKKATFSG